MHSFTTTIDDQPRVVIFRDRASCISGAEVSVSGPARRTIFVITPLADTQDEATAVQRLMEQVPHKGATVGFEIPNWECVDRFVDSLTQAAIESFGQRGNVFDAQTTKGFELGYALVASFPDGLANPICMTWFEWQGDLEMYHRDVVSGVVDQLALVANGAPVHAEMTAALERAFELIATAPTELASRALGGALPLLARVYRGDPDGSVLRATAHEAFLKVLSYPTPGVEEVLRAMQTGTPISD